MLNRQKTNKQKKLIEKTRIKICHKNRRKKKLEQSHNQSKKNDKIPMTPLMKPKDKKESLINSLLSEQVINFLSQLGRRSEESSCKSGKLERIGEGGDGGERGGGVRRRGKRGRG